MKRQRRFEEMKNKRERLRNKLYLSLGYKAGVDFDPEPQAMQ